MSAKGPEPDIQVRRLDFIARWHADQLPSFRTEIAQVLSPTNPLGIKAGGEGGTTGALACIVSGILDALRPLGVTDIAMPATPYRIWQAIQDAKGRSAAS